MTTRKVKFLPEGKKVEVDENTTVMEAAEKAGVHINNLCGGKGVCGRCRVQISDGKVRADKHSINFLSKEELQEGYVLACQTNITSDMDVIIPPESRLEAEQILLEGPVMDYSQPEKICVPRIPFGQKRIRIISLLFCEYFAGFSHAANTFLFHQSIYPSRYEVVTGIFPLFLYD